MSPSSNLRAFAVILSLIVSVASTVSLVAEFPAEATIPEEALGVLRGTDSSTLEDHVYTCSEAAADEANESQPPSDWWVANNHCDEPFATGNPCVQCSSAAYGEKTKPYVSTGTGLDEVDDTFSCFNEVIPGSIGECDDGDCVGPFTEFSCMFDVSDYKRQESGPGGGGD